MKVKDVMTRDVITVAAGTPLRDVARILGESRISGVPVVDETGACIGVVSEEDLLAKQVSRPATRRTPFEWIVGEQQDPEEARRRAATTAAQAMSSPAVTIEPDRPLREAATLMVDRDVNRLPVVSGEQLVGIITRADMVRAYLRLDDEILVTIRDEVMRRTMWLDPREFEVEVHDGHVRIAGSVDRRSTAGIIERLISVVDGVVEVASEIGWDFDDTHLRRPPEPESQPGAASLAAREEPQPMHR